MESEAMEKGSAYFQFGEITGAQHPSRSIHGGIGYGYFGQIHSNNASIVSIEKAMLCMGLGLHLDKVVGPRPNLKFLHVVDYKKALTCSFLLVLGSQNESAHFEGREFDPWNIARPGLPTLVAAELITKCIPASTLVTRPNNPCLRVVYSCQTRIYTTRIWQTRHEF
ncbi:hypothetical protein LXL04_025980 [Taraxacum kok-saghyz]